MYGLVPTSSAYHLGTTSAYFNYTQNNCIGSTGASAVR